MKKFKFLSFFLLATLILIVAGCGPAGKFKQAERLEKKGKHYEAWEAYQEFAAQFPTSKQAPQALYRAGWLSQKYLNDCFAASVFFDKVMEKYPQSDPWAKAAAMQKLNCPDYFPLIYGNKWVEGDKETQGQIAKTEIECKPIGSNSSGLPSENGALDFSYYAGDKLFKTNEMVYRKTDGELHEYSSEGDPRYKTILKWPLGVGQNWTTKADQKIYHYEVKADSLDVKVIAGEFKDCIKVASFAEGTGGGITNEYYAPNVGRILKTISTAQGENRVTELLSYSAEEEGAPKASKGKKK